MGSSSKYAAIWGLLIGDAIAMPVHWYYNPMYIKRDYGSWLTGYVPPKEKHPTSIMNLSSTVGSGRSSGKNAEEKEIIGNVILHNKRQFWGRSSGIHYHHGMKAGENTLNATLAVEIFKTLQTIDPEASLDPVANRGSVMEHYIRFMTTPDTHNDTYAESCHRMFFKDWVQEAIPPKDGPSLVKFCEDRFRKVKPGQEDSQIPCIGAFILVIPWIVYYADKSEDICAKSAVEAIKLTHPAPSVLGFVELYARLLHAVINGFDLRKKVLEIAESPVLGHPNKRKIIEKFSEEASRFPKGSDERLTVYQEAIAVLGMACYLQGSMPSMLFLAHEFADDLKGGVLTNANCGGENAHRGGALGALLAAEAMNKRKEVDSGLTQGLFMFEKYKNILKE